MSGQLEVLNQERGLNGSQQAGADDSLMQLIERVAISPDADIAKLERLFEFKERWERHAARKAFDEAVAAARAEIPPIAKNRTVDFTSIKGRTNYRHEDLAEIARTVDPVLSKHGLSYRWRTNSSPNEPVSVTCIVSHRMGYSEENTLCAGRDDTGNKNGIQAIGSTITYLQRYTLKAALGLAASNDDDGRGIGNGAAVSDEQAAELTRLATAAKCVDAFLKWIGAPSISDVPAAKYEQAVAALRARQGAQGGARK